MLKKKCNITANSKIYLDEDNSFNGFERTIYEEETSQMLRNELTKAHEMKNNVNDKIVKENTPIVYKCETDIETYIIPAKDIISIKPFLIPNDEGGETYMKVEYYDDELCINNTIFCKEVNSYRPICIPIFKVGMRVRNKQTGYVNTIKQITTNHYMFNLGEYVFDIEDGFSITKQNEWEEI